MRTIRVFAKSEDGYPLVNSEIELLLGDVSLGRTKDNNGQASFEVEGAAAPLSVIVYYEGKSVGPRTFAADQESLEISFLGVFLGPNAQQLAEQRDKQRRWEARMAFLKENFAPLLGVLMLGAALALAFAFDHPNAIQILLLRITASLAVGCIATIITGSLGLTVSFGPKLGVTAAGALAAFALSFLVDPGVITGKILETAPAANTATPAANDQEPAANMG